MFSCMYFLMYDKSGVDEIVPCIFKRALLKRFYQTLPLLKKTLHALFLAARLNITDSKDRASFALKIKAKKKKLTRI